MMQANTKRKVSWGSRFLSSREFAPLLSLVVIFTLFAIIAPRFTMFWNIKILCKQAAINGILGIALFLIVLTGGIDVSIGANLALQCVIIGHCVDWNLPVPVIVVVVLTTGALIGLLVARSPTMAPPSASGSDTRMVSGCSRLPNSTASTT